MFIWYYKSRLSYWKSLIRCRNMYILEYCNMVHPLHFLFVLLYSSSKGGVYCFTPVCLKVLPSVPWNFHHIFLRNYKPELSVHGFIMCDTISDSLHINILFTFFSHFSRDYKSQPSEIWYMDSCQHALPCDLVFRFIARHLPVYQIPLYSKNYSNT